MPDSLSICPWPEPDRRCSGGPALAFADVTIRYGEFEAVKEASFDLAFGSVTALLGPNGAGKSSLVSAASGLIAPASGCITASASVGTAIQEVALYPTLTVAQNLRFFAELNCPKDMDWTRQVASLVKYLGIDDLRSRTVGTLSGGQKRMVHVLASSVHLPGLLILDEPTEGLDQDMRKRLLDFVHAYAASSRAVLYVSHHLDEVEKVASRIILLECGRVRKNATIEDFVRYGAPAFVSVITDMDLAGLFDKVTRAGASDQLIEVSDPKLELPGLISKITSAGGQITSVRVIERSLEGAVANTTGRSE